MNSEKREIRLPEKISDCILLALADLEKVEKSPDYTVEMGSWHEPRPRGTCAVCLAGAAMAMTLKVAKGFDFRGGTISAWNDKRVEAINDARTGNFTGMAISLGVAYTSELRKLDYKWSSGATPYKDDPKKFKRDMRQIAKALQKINL